MNIEDVLKLVRPNILGLEAYSTARDDCGSNQPEIFLDANENPYNNGINRYPDPHQKALKAKVAEIKGISADSLFIGNGSDEAIDLVYRVFCVPGASNAVSIAPSYGMYEVAAAMNDIEFRKETRSRWSRSRIFLKGSAAWWCWMRLTSTFRSGLR